MASIARCLRVARPSTLARLAQVPRVQPSWYAARTFSASAIRDVRKYTNDHEWIDLNADKTEGVIGITEYAAHELGDVVFVEMPQVGQELEAGDTLGAIESVKSAADIHCPVACSVTEVNTLLEEKPGTASQLPEDDSVGGGWVARVTVGEQGRKDFEELMDAAEYQQFIGAEEH